MISMIYDMVETDVKKTWSFRVILGPAFQVAAQTFSNIIVITGYFSVYLFWNNFEKGAGAEKETNQKGTAMTCKDSGIIISI